jgi:hypothetical protein
MQLRLPRIRCWGGGEGAQLGADGLQGGAHPLLGVEQGPGHALNTGARVLRSAAGAHRSKGF